MHGTRAVHRANALFDSRSSSLGATARRDERISRPRAARLVASGAASATELCAHAPLSGLLGPSPEPTNEASRPAGSDPERSSWGSRQAGTQRAYAHEGRSTPRSGTMATIDSSFPTEDFGPCVTRFERRTAIGP